MREEKGITLVALIITIIVLLTYPTYTIIDYGLLTILKFSSKVFIFKKKIWFFHYFLKNFMYTKKQQ